MISNYKMESKLPYEDLLPTNLVKLVNLLGNNPEDEYTLTMIDTTQ